MEYRRLGQSGLKVSELCLGTMTFGHGADEATARQMVDLAFDKGINFFDTANTYGGGQSELMLGRALRERRRDAVVATKLFNPTGPGPNDSGLSRVHVMRSVEDSLRRLQMDHVDVYYMHHVDTETPLDETLRALDDLVRQGKVRYIAVSNYEAWRTMEALWVSKSNGWSSFICYQPQYSLIVRDIELELIPLSLYKGLGVVVWGPLAGGFLSGKYLPGQRMIPGTRSEEKWVFPERFLDDIADEILETLLDVADTLEHSPSQVAIRWVMEQPAVSSVIVGARSLEQLADNLGAAEWRLTDEARERLTQVSQMPERYPQTVARTVHERRTAAVGNQQRIVLAPAEEPRG
jgi:aryl-alcohol dehydrogenase-like predicted oxidoreductase